MKFLIDFGGKRRDSRNSHLAVGGGSMEDRELTGGSVGQSKNTNMLEEMKRLVIRK